MRAFFDWCEIVVAVSVDDWHMCVQFAPMPRTMPAYRRWLRKRARVHRYVYRIAYALGYEVVAYGRDHEGMRPLYRRGE